MEQYIHNMSPFAIHFAGEWGIRWYGLAYISGFLFGSLFIRFMAKRSKIELPIEQVTDFITYMALGVILGGRLGYCLFYYPELLIKFSASFPFWGALEIHKGGMASHGGILGVIIAAFLYGRSKKINGLHILDLTVIGAAIAFFFGRWANFINGELYGRAAPSTLSWAVKFPKEMHTWLSESPEKLKGLGAAVIEIGSLRTKAETLRPDKFVWDSWVNSRASDKINVYLNEIFVAIERGQESVIQLVGPALTPRYPSQLIQAGLEGLLLFICLFLIWYKARKPGVLSGWFGMIYALARIIGEQYRLPDAHIGYELFGMTRGQWLSVGLFTAGLIMLIYSIKQDTEKLGGWARQK